MGPRIQKKHKRIVSSNTQLYSLWAPANEQEVTMSLVMQNTGHIVTLDMRTI